MLGALKGLPQEAIARRWKPAIRQQSVRDHLQGAAWDSIRWVLVEFERCYGIKNNTGQ